MLVLPYYVLLVDFQSDDLVRIQEHVRVQGKLDATHRIDASLSQLFDQGVAIL